LVGGFAANQPLSIPKMKRLVILNEVKNLEHFAGHQWFLLKNS